MKRILLIFLSCIWLNTIVAGQPGGKDYAVVNLSVCNMRDKPDFSAEMITQAIMGMPLRVLDHQDWYQIQTPDDYTGWVHRDGIYCMTLEEIQAWNLAEKVVVTQVYGFVYETPNKKSQTICDVVAGNRMKYLGKKGKFFHVELPDGRRGFLLRKEGALLSEWRKSLKSDVSSILATAKKLMGVPYLWAGTSTKGMDCSGFVRTVLYQHDMIIPRDTGPQSRSGQRIDISSDYSNLQPGDLIFFGRKATEDQKERVSHVGIYMGNKRFIHSLGRVKTGSFDPNAEDYDAYNLGRLLFAARVLPFINRQEGLNTTDKNLYYSTDFR